MINSLRIEVNPSITILSGFDYGRAMFNNRYSMYDVDVSKEYYLILPEQIEGICSDFVNGFFEKIIEKIGAEKAAERLCINNKVLEADVKEKILLNK